MATGHYLHSICQFFYVHFGVEVSNVCTEDSCFFYNETDPESIAVLPYGPFSGIYEVYRDSRGKFEWKERRPVYYERNIEFGEESHPGKFSYCKSEKAWVFTIKGIRKAFSDDCNWLLRSQKTEAYSLGDAPTTGWSIWTDNALAPADPQFELSCGGWESDVDCSYLHGSCEKKICVCDPSWTGRNCQTKVECIAYMERPVYYSYTVNKIFWVLFYSAGRFNIIEREGLDIHPILVVQDKDLAKLRDYINKVQSGVLLYGNGYLDVNTTLTFVSEFTTATTPISVDVTGRYDWPTNGTTIHFSCKRERERERLASVNPWRQELFQC
eukprot:scaffold172237_cov52-Attheya_sp.AAC.3